MVTGILYGLGAALLQAVSYLCSAVFISRYRTGATTHLILVHIVMGLFSLILLPVLWHPLVTDISSYWMPLLGVSASYLWGQFSLYQAIQCSAASRVSPLLGLKVLVLVLIGSTVFGDQYKLLQWAAVGLCVIGAVWLSASGGRIGWKASGWVLSACVSYAFSDLSIVYLIQYFSSLPLLSATLLSVTLCFLVCGLSCLVFLARIKQPGLLLASAPAAISWFLALGSLFACFAELGVVFGGIVQSSRGLISILLTLALAGLGLSFADPLPPAKVLIQRLCAASLMTLAIVLFSMA